MTSTPKLDATPLRSDSPGGNDSAATQARIAALQAVRRLLAVAHAAEGDSQIDEDERALNLAHYVAVYRAGLDGVSKDLQNLGLSLNGIEDDVLGVLSKARTWLDDREMMLSLQAAASPVSRRQNWLANDGERGPAIIVTAPVSGLTAAMVADWLERGAAWVRINAAHGSQNDWRATAEAVRAGATESGLPARVLVDLPGPKVRVTPLERAPPVIKVGPRRDAWGQVDTPGFLTVLPGRAPERPRRKNESIAYVDDSLWLSARSVGEMVELTDARGRKRKACVAMGDGKEVVLSLRRTTYVTSTSTLRARGERRKVWVEVARGEPLAVLQSGSLLRLFRSLDASRSSESEAGPVVEASVSHPEVLDGTVVGEPAVLDDGRFRGHVVGVDREAVTVAVTRVRGGSARLRGAKGLLFPHRESSLPLLGEVDRAALEFAAEQADAVALSFARDERDVQEVIAAMPRDKRPLGLIVKIETQSATKRPEAICRAALSWPNAAVMIARGDLAVALGFENLARAQARLKAVARAAGLPVIVATQVLESLTRDGVPSRAEMIDADAAVACEGVMLNKGHFVGESVTMLGELLRDPPTGRQRNSMPPHRH